MAENTRDLARRLNALNRQVKAISQPRLGFSSIEFGEGIEQYVDELLAQRFGTQYDGTNTHATFNGPKPPRPEQLLVTPAPGGLRIYWDGTFADGEVAPMDFSRVSIYVVEDPADFHPLAASQIVGHISSATGGEIFASLPRSEHYVFAVAWSQAGKFSDGSEAAFGTPGYVTADDLEPIVAPTSSPTPIVRSAWGALVVAWETERLTTVDIYVSESPGGNIGQMRPVASVTGQGVGVQWIRALADGTDLDLDASYYVTLVASNAGGYAQPSDTVEGSGARPTGDDIDVTADMLIANFALIEALAAVNVHITGELIATSVTADGKVALRNAENELAPGAWLIMKGATSAPVTSATITQGWDYFTLPGTNHTWRYGGHWHGGRYYYVSSVFGGSNVWSVATNGTQLVHHIPPTGSGSWDARGLTRVGSNWFLLVKDYDRGGEWRIRIYNDSWAYQSDFSVFPDTIPYDPAIGTDGTNILLARAWNSGVVHLQEVAPGGTTLSDTTTPITITSHLGTVMRGNFDYGSSRVVITTRDRSKERVFVLNAGATTRQSGDEWSLVEEKHAGLAWDGSRFRSMSRSSGRVWSYEADMGTSRRWVGGAWVHPSGGQTLMGPLAPYDPEKRKRALVTFPPLPEGAAGIRVYMGLGTSAPSQLGMWRVAASHPSPVYYVRGTPVLGGTENPPSQSSYPSGQPSGIKNDGGHFKFDSTGELVVRKMTQTDNPRQIGRHESGTMVVGVTKSTRIDFATPFPAVPVIQLNAQNIANPASVAYTASGVDKNGFTLNVERSAGTSSVSVGWTAEAVT